MLSIAHRAALLLRGVSSTVVTRLQKSLLERMYSPFRHMRSRIAQALHLLRFLMVLKLITLFFWVAQSSMVISLAINQQPDKFLYEFKSFIFDVFASTNDEYSMSAD